MLKWQKVEDPGGRIIGYEAYGAEGRRYWAERRFPRHNGWMWGDGNSSVLLARSLFQVKSLCNYREDVRNGLTPS